MELNIASKIGRFWFNLHFKSTLLQLKFTVYNAVLSFYIFQEIMVIFFKILHVFWRDMVTKEYCNS